MKRSKINNLIDEGIVFLNSRNYTLPPQAFWSLKDWYKNREKVGEITKRRIGWDLTDFDSGDYKKTGLLLYTLSNGFIGQDGKPVDQSFSNKILIVEENQVTPMHHHRSKMEDIINLGGGNLQIKIYNMDKKEGVEKYSPLKIFHNEMWESYEPGTVINLKPGDRIRLDPNHYHEFWGQPGHGKTLVEEVSSVNDDRTDNIFVDKPGRFPEITEDEKPKYLLCTELPGTDKFNDLIQKYLETG
ncbi:MAG: D-lyxose/D-mannose family sugar isomerase [Candidatus Aminicenantes bacterium]|nr:D-lyxose/D-mannose family sugar isomerase [Candidatus Aminicenantes bacterium]